MTAGIENPIANPKLASGSFRSLFTNSPTAMLVEDENGDLKDANASACELFGASRTEIIGRKLSELIPGNRPFPSINGGTCCNESLLSVKGSLPMRVSLHSATIETESGKASLISIWPASQAKSHLDSIQDNELNNVQRASEHIANFIADSMTPIQGFVSLAQNDLKKGQIRSVHLQQISKAADRGATFARELFNLSRQKPGKLETLTASELLTELKSELTQSAVDSAKTIFTFPKETPEIDIARSDFRIIMLHAIRNAAAGGGDNIEIACIPQTNTPTPPTASSDPFVTIRVTDDGNVIESHCSKRAFEPFFSLPQRDDPHGLRLPTIKQLMANYGGTTHLVSSHDEGTVLMLSFPASRH